MLFPRHIHECLIHHQVRNIPGEQARRVVQHAGGVGGITHHGHIDAVGEAGWEGKGGVEKQAHHRHPSCAQGVLRFGEAWVHRQGRTARGNQARQQRRPLRRARQQQHVRGRNAMKIGHGLPGLLLRLC